MAREDSLYMARLAEETERYEDLVSSSGAAPTKSGQAPHDTAINAASTRHTWTTWTELLSLRTTLAKGCPLVLCGRHHIRSRVGQ